jgi:hypothetical protein
MIIGVFGGGGGEKSSSSSIHDRYAAQRAGFFEDSEH